MTKNTNEHGFINVVYEGKTHEDLYNCLFACFLSQEEPKIIAKTLCDPTWVEVMQEKLLQFKLQKVWILVDLPKGKRAIGIKWILQNKNDVRGIVTRNKARLVAQGYTQEEGIDYDEVFAHVARIKAIRLFLAYASFMGFMVYQMDVKSDFLYGTVEEEVKQREDGIFISQDKYVAEILRKFGFTDVKTASTPIDTEKPLLKDSDGDDVDVHLYRSMIGSLMYLTSSRPDIMIVCNKQTVVATSSTEAEYVAAASCCRQVLWIQNQMLDYGLGILSIWEIKRGQDTKIPQSSGPPEKVDDEAVHKELGDRMERAATTGTGSDSGPRCEDTKLGGVDAQTRIGVDTARHKLNTASIKHLKLEDSDGISTLPTTDIFEQLALMGNMKRASKGYTRVDTPLFQTMLTQGQTLQGGHTPGSDEGSMTLKELTVLCTRLSKKVASLEANLKQTKKVYGNAYTKLIMKVKKLEHKGRKIAQIDEDEGITLVQMSAQTQERQEYDFEFTAPEEDYTAKPDISTANVPVSTACPEVSTASPEVRTAAESLVYISRSVAKRKDKGKAIMKEAEPVQKKTKQRIARVQEEASTFNTEEWDNIQAQIEADEELALRLQAQEREGYSEADKARLLHIGSHTLQQLKKLSFDEIKELFKITMKRVNTFTAMESDDTVSKVVAGSSKRDDE
ncbi:putative ribonuclease H-like domain-containing protein [Tanacetum coccineum]|uniref:Ribonuclease H-like domain-containing protein n=1 Tax=Tanacetum coccineum TaxID=301880 RepID=A0ABQ5GJK2_9ASTR